VFRECTVYRTVAHKKHARARERRRLDRREFRLFSVGVLSRRRCPACVYGDPGALFSAASASKAVFRART